MISKIIRRITGPVPYLVTALFFFTAARAQQSDTLEVSPGEKVVFAPADTLQADSIRHSPRKAAIFSAVLPGLGQAYNKKYWKIPVIYAGLGTIAYFAANKHKNYRLFRDEYIAQTDGDTNTVSLYPYATPEQLLTVSDSYRRNRDLLIIIATGVYVLNIVDAAVDAHLFTFDVSEDLSLRAAPGIMVYREEYRPALSLSLKF